MVTYSSDRMLRSCMTSEDGWPIRPCQATRSRDRLTSNEVARPAPAVRLWRSRIAPKPDRRCALPRWASRARRPTIDGPMRIAIPKEIMADERRVAATPETVAKYRKLGHDVYVETAAGAGIFASDDAYRAAGACVVD